MTLRPMIEYSDVRGRPVQLTKAEQDWFWELVEKANKVSGNRIQIIPFNFDLYTDEDGQNALGRTYTTDPENPLSDDAKTLITIDTYHIHECFDVVFNGAYCFEDATLEETIAHEIAHTHYWKHGKRHTALTERYLSLMQAA